MSIRREGGKEGKRERGKEERRKGGKEERREGGKEGRQEESENEGGEREESYHELGWKDEDGNTGAISSPTPGSSCTAFYSLAIFHFTFSLRHTKEIVGRRFAGNRTAAGWHRVIL